MKRSSRKERDLSQRLDTYIDHLNGQAAQSTAPESGGPPGIDEDTVARALEHPRVVAALLYNDAAVTTLDPEFLERLSRELRARHAETASAPMRAHESERMSWTPIRRFSWVVTVVVAVIATLAAVTLVRPKALHADRILAQAAASVQPASGRIEHVIADTSLVIRSATGSSITLSYLEETWRRIEPALNGHATAVEAISAHYAVTDTERLHPLSWSLEKVWSKYCYLDMHDYPRIYRDPGTDEQGCLSLGYAADLALPSPFAQAMVVNPLSWIGQLQAAEGTLNPERTTLLGRPAYKFVDTREEVTITLYVDRRTQVPLAFFVETSGYSLAQVVHEYEQLAPDALNSDLFAWPPQIARRPGIEFDLQPLAP